MPSPIETLIQAEIAAEVSRQLALASPAPALAPALLSVAEAATYLGRSKKALQHQLAKGQLKVPVVREGGRRIFFHRRDLDEWIERDKY